MLQIENSIISFDLFDKKFVCDLEKCKGACCIEGDAGAPLDDKEINIIKDCYSEIEKYMRSEGIKAVKEQGVAIQDTDGEYVTPLVNGAECAYTIFENGIAKCAIEKAFLDKKITYRKPISCYLYPIRISKYKNFDAVNYHKWPICDAARTLGEKLNVQVYKFLEQPLITHYGKDWYEQLSFAAENLER